MLGAIIVCGMMLGSLITGYLIKQGRRKALLIGCITGIIGCLITMDLSFHSCLLGRFFFGVSVGIVTGVAARFTEETIPNHL